MPAEATGAIGGQDTEVSFLGINGNSPWSPSDSCELAAPGQILRLQSVHVCNMWMHQTTMKSQAFAPEKEKFETTMQKLSALNHVQNLLTQIMFQRFLEPI